MFRQTLPGQVTPIAGEIVPEKVSEIASLALPGLLMNHAQTKVGVPQLASYHNTRNFHDPTNFHPERWLPSATTDPKSPFFNDRRDAHRPFSVGPRDCIGRNLAYHEMRLILARLVWEFDLELVGGGGQHGEEWLQRQKIWIFWDKGPLMVRLRRRTEN